MHRDGRLQIGPNIIPELLPEIPEELEHTCNALVCRPTWGGQVTDELVERLRIPGQPFTVATLSSGTSHISAANTGDTTVLSASKGNSEQTAELTVFLAICLLRRAFSPMVNMGFGVYHRPELNRTSSLQDLTWVVAGPGTVGEAVLKKAAAMGAGALRAYHPKFASMQPDAITAKWPEYSSLAAQGVELVGAVDHALRGADVVTVHVPSNEHTLGMVDASWFDLLPNSAVLVNCSRHEVIDEAALLAALERNHVAGYASDVLPPRSERRAANPHAPEVELWRRACWSTIASIERCTHAPGAFQDVALAESFLPGRPVGERNVIYTPHIGGSTRDAEIAVAGEVVTELLNELDVTA